MTCVLPDWAYTQLTRPQAEAVAAMWRMRDNAEF